VRWLALALPYVRLRLRLALGAERRRDAVRALLLRPGRVYANATHLDLVMDIGQISLPARLAGLDRDPGWLPEFGRVVRFHFEGKGEEAR
jgi:hypothetical protein